MKSLFQSKHREGAKQLIYGEHRDVVQNCDVLLYSGTNLASKVIRHFMKSRYSHVGVIAWWNDRVMVMEAVDKGVIATPLSENLKRHRGGVDYYKCTVDMADHQRTSMIQFAQAQLGKEYNMWQVLKSGIRAVLRLSLRDKHGAFKHPAGRYFCSQYVSDIYKEGGVDLNIDLNSVRVSPGAIADSPLMEMHSVIKRS
jgi:hypothetical protein